MYIPGLTMQDRDPKIPTEVAEWIKERMDKYPQGVDFELNYIGIEKHTIEQRQQYQEFVKKYSRFYTMRGIGVMSVTFPYFNESWNVKILVGADKEGNILNMDNAEVYNKNYDIQRTNQLRNEIAGLPGEDQIEKIQDAVVGQKRQHNEPFLEVPKEYVEFPY